MVANLVGDGMGKDCFDFWASQSGGTRPYLMHLTHPTGQNAEHK